MIGRIVREPMAYGVNRPEREPHENARSHLRHEAFACGDIGLAKDITVWEGSPKGRDGPAIIYDLKNSDAL
ncbi:MAG TPA: hypothetical protein VGO52_15055 [Hyphomonadaceae bacterium]|jgi:hypothetical protein|nr:hypothetical protein [Hyphomonadaceae bacterium]